MPNPYFSFKQFTVYHDRCAMKVGTDGVLLGAWTDVSSSQKILDVGTGTGLIALMLAQRCIGARITAIDIDGEAILQARENMNASPWGSRMETILQDLKTYQPGKLFDTIVSNPPFFVDSLKCPDHQRNMARHTDTLPALNLLRKSAELLKENGKLSLILPAEQTEDLVALAAGEGLYLSRLTSVITRPGLPPKRSLMEFRKQVSVCEKNNLVVELARHVYTEDYIALTRDFYLKM